MIEEKLHPIFADCCAQKNCIYDIDKPFVQNGFAYATDAKIIVRQKTDAPDTDVVVPSVGDLFDDFRGGQSVEIPEVEFDERICEECGGKGEWICTECKQDVICSACEGNGNFSDPLLFVPLSCGFGISNRYAAILYRHGVRTACLPDDPDRPCRFYVGEDIEGLLMSIRKGKMPTWEPPQEE